MISKVIWFKMVVLTMLLLAACAPAAKTPDAMMAQPTSTMMAKSEETMKSPTETMMDQGTVMPTADTMGDGMKPTDDSMHPTEAMASTPTASMDPSVPATGMKDPMADLWVEKELTNSATGKTFKLNDFKGKVVLVEMFAQWCPTCLAQQKEVVKLHQMMGMDEDLITVSLDVDPNEDAAMLKSYLDQHGFDWHYAVAPAEVSREISQLYGNQFLNPPSAPMLVIDRNGEAHPLPFGVKSAADLQKALDPFLKDGM